MTPGRAQMTEVQGRAATVVELFKRLSQRRFQEIADLLTPDATFEVPYGDVVAAGRDEFVAMFAVVTAKLFDPFEFSIDAVYEATDDVTVVVEYRTDGTVKLNGNPYANRYVGVFRVVHDKIALWREYFNPVVFNDAAGDVVESILADAR